MYDCHHLETIYKENVWVQFMIIFCVGFLCRVSLKSNTAVYNISFLKKMLPSQSSIQLSTNQGETSIT